jgi:hypothetical protein
MAHKPSTHVAGTGCVNGHPPDRMRSPKPGWWLCRDCANAKTSARYAANRSEMQERKRLPTRDRRRILRASVIAEMGGCCVRCGFSDVRALQIDHVYGGGRRELRQLTTAQFYVRLRQVPGDYQLLCANCNAIKKVENNEVGHYSASGEGI